MIWDFFAALAFAVLMLALLVGLLGWGRRGDAAVGWGAGLFAFLILLFGIWAGGVWIRPAGPLAAGIAWVPLLVVGLIIVFMLAAVLPPPPRRHAPTGPGTSDTAVAVGYTIFFWLLMVAFWVALLAAYL